MLNGGVPVAVTANVTLLLPHWTVRLVSEELVIVGGSATVRVATLLVIAPKLFVTDKL